MVILKDYIPGNHKINPSLLWEYDISNFDWDKSKIIVAQRVIELGSPNDYYAAFDLYGGIAEFKEIVKKIPYLNSLDMHFVCVIFDLKKEELRCYKKQPSSYPLWNY